MYRATSLLLAVLACAWNAAQAADLLVTVTNAGTKGDIRIRVHDTEAGFSAGINPVAQIVIRPVNGRASLTLHGLPVGTYAAAAFQDVDGNQTLTTNVLGIPNEPYGWSGETDSGDFSKAATTLGETGGSLTVRLR